jgi:hypothetical protein
MVGMRFVKSVYGCPYYRIRRYLKGNFMLS